MKNTATLKTEKTILPTYSFLPLCVTVVLHFVAYTLSGFINSGFYHHNIHLGIDELIPLCPEWTIVYVATFFFWMAGLVMIMRERKDKCFELFACLNVSYILCFVTFLVWPTTMPRPALTVDGYASQLLSVLWSLDNPTNLFPSMHCLLSWLCFRASLRCEKTNTFYKVLSFFAALLIFASAVLVKQHVFVDIIGGILYAEISLFLGTKLNGKNYFYYIEKKLLKKSL